MWRRKLRKNKFLIFLRNSLLAILGLTALYLLTYFVFNNFLLNKGEIVSPLSRTTVRNDSLEGVLIDSKIPFSKIERATDSSYLVFIKDGGVVSFSSTRDFRKQVSSLQLILSRLTIEGKRFKRLDLRFDKPVIVF